MMRCTTTAGLAVSMLASAATAQLEPVWSFESGNAALGSPTIADVDGNGVRDVIQATGGIPGNAGNDGFVYVLDIEGNMLPGWPVHIDRPIFHPLAVADLDGDGDVELVAQAWNYMYVWHHDGTVVDGYPIVTGNFTSNAPCLADLDGDGALDIIYTDGFFMSAIRLDQSLLPGWPKSAPESFQAPSVGDIDGDGEVEVVAGTWRPNFPDPVEYELYAWEADGTTLAGFPIQGLGSIRGSVSLGDLDGDGTVELVTRAGDTLHVFDASGSEREGWPQTPGVPIRNATPTMGDMDGDGDLEIVIGAFDLLAYHDDGTFVSGFPAATEATGNINSPAVVANVDDETATLEVLVKISNAIEGFNSDGTDAPGFPFALDDGNATGTFTPGPAVEDMDGDGDVEMVFTSVNGTVVLLDEAGSTDAPLQWTQAGYDVLNTSFIPRESGCIADCDANGELNVLDFVCFQGEWTDQTAFGDCDGNGSYDILDFVCFQGAFVEGCP